MRTAAGGRRRWFDQPELHLALFGFLFAFAWEMWQMPFYDVGDIAIFDAVRTCSVASLGDAVLMVVAYTLTSLFSRCRHWLVTPRVPQIAVYLGTGLLGTVLFEEVATAASWGWTYSDLMPLLPGTRIALVPILMWIVVPLLSLGLARRQPM